MIARELSSRPPRPGGTEPESCVAACARTDVLTRQLKVDAIVKLTEVVQQWLGHAADSAKTTAMEKPRQPEEKPCAEGKPEAPEEKPEEKPEAKSEEDKEDSAAAKEDREAAKEEQEKVAKEREAKGNGAKERSFKEMEAEERQAEERKRAAPAEGPAVEATGDNKDAKATPVVKPEPVVKQEPAGEQNPQEGVQQEVKEETSEAVVEPEDKLNKALRDAAKLHGIGFPQHLRPASWLDIVLNEQKVLQIETEAELDKVRLIWRRSNSAMLQLAIAYKAAVISLTKHLTKNENDKKKQEEKANLAEDKLRLDGVKKEMQRRATQIASQASAQSGSKPAVYASFFTLKRGHFESLSTYDCDISGLPKEFQAHAPSLIEVKPMVDDLITNKKMQQVLTSFGGKYKKLAGFKEDGKVQNTLQVKQGKEEAEAFFAKLTKQVSAQQAMPMDVTQQSSSQGIIITTTMFILLCPL